MHTYRLMINPYAFVLLFSFPLYRLIRVRNRLKKELNIFSD
ncbi:hypothetical protein ACNA06_14810 [Lysinibacillus sp. RSDA_15]|uniref:Uncharacterized protein n=2 Tax=Lysinibacillus TaxID=400634 RepID=B1HVW1_LYSSC|nr:MULTISPECIES: hypothetical protein [Lysinibacillus]ACA39809.1 hypothetical protein Bsph_2244 [Lysinibacillus sphaericus C3-41]MCS1396718.1 hypothetical protein [Lysinibacillus sp. PB211]MDM5350428.1 hypothetical protein [Lysinibacillus sphaericus]MDR0157695.1 hypothetical protein [Lysinibacillus sphaericus]